MSNMLENNNASIEHWLADQWVAVAEADPKDPIRWRQLALQCWLYEAKYASYLPTKKAILNRIAILQKELEELAK